MSLLKLNRKALEVAEAALLQRQMLMKGEKRVEMEKGQIIYSVVKVGGSS